MLINILYEGDYSDCDLIWVPDIIGRDIETYGQQFCDWLNTASVSNEYFIKIDEKICIGLETEGFVNWINNHILKGDQLSYIVKQHVEFNSDYNVVEF